MQFPEKETQTPVLCLLAKRLEPIREGWERKDTEAPEWPERYKALALKALWRGEMAIGRYLLLPETRR